jgi:hypothetical protein
MIDNDVNSIKSSLILLENRLFKKAHLAGRGNNQELYHRLLRLWGRAKEGLLRA